MRGGGCSSALKLPRRCFLPRQALSHNMTSTAQLQMRINELMSELSDAQVRVGVDAKACKGVWPGVRCQWGEQSRWGSLTAPCTSPPPPPAPPD